MRAPSSGPSDHLLPQAGEGKRFLSPSPVDGRGVGVRAREVAARFASAIAGALIRSFGPPSPASGRR
ncbi:hypothetical protein [Lysobacter gummosus]|uniref:hypothetical protein n=1 Tax=Lysobacter gummosus TaxID=262324 RepID=UPI0036305C55